MAKWMPLEENIFLMCGRGTCAECRAENGQLSMQFQDPLPVNPEVLEDALDQDLLEEANSLRQGNPAWLDTIERIMKDGAQGVTPKMKQLYLYIQLLEAKYFRYGPNGWEKSPEVPENDQE